MLVAAFDGALAAEGRKNGCFKQKAKFADLKKSGTNRKIDSHADQQGQHHRPPYDSIDHMVDSGYPFRQHIENLHIPASL